MRQKFSFILLAIAVLAGFSACVKTDDSFGAGFIPSDQQLHVETYSINNMPVYTATIDSLPTSNGLYTGVFGCINAAPFGNVNAGAVFRIYPSVSDHRFGEHPEFISAELMLVISGRKTASDDQKDIVQNIRLHELTKTLYYDTTYYNNSITDANYKPEQIDMPGTTYNGGDTLVIQLTREYGDFLMAATDSEMDSLTPFYARYKGFILKTDSLQSGQAGGRLNMFDISKSYLTLKYKTDEGRDSSFVYRGDYGLSFNSYRHSSAPLANYTNPPAPLSQTIYIEGLAGVKPVIDLLSIRDSIDALLTQKQLRRDQLLINQANVTISIASTSDMGHYPTRIALCSNKINSAGKLTFPLISDSYQYFFGGSINRSLMSYSFNVAKYLQSIVQPEQVSDITNPTAMYVFPIQMLVDSYGSTYPVIDIINYSYGDLLGTSSIQSVKFDLVYTVLY